MSKRPYVILKVAASIDGRINDKTPNGHPLSNAEDLDRVDQVRADCDAILIGAGTFRNDNPRMTIKSPARRAARLAAGKPEHLTKVIVTGTGDLDPSYNWFHTPGRRMIYTTDEAAPALRAIVGDLAEVIEAGPTIDFEGVLDHLGKNDIETLLVEGGEVIHTELLTLGLADELHYVLAPLLIGTGPRFVSETKFPWPAKHRFEVIEIRPIGDVVLVRFRVSPPSPSDK